MSNRQKDNVQLIIQKSAAKIVLCGDVLEYDSDGIVQDIWQMPAKNVNNISFGKHLTF